MPFIVRDQSGNITALENEAVGEVIEELPADHPEVLAFIKHRREVAKAKELLFSSDAEMVRVIEDLVDVLIAKKVIMHTDLPLIVQEKLLGRQRARQRMKSLSNLMVDEEDII